jgi:glycosyltransferase involved in cell wall biosynthesis
MFYFVITGHKMLGLAKQCIESLQAQLGSFRFSTLYIDDCSGYTPTEIKLLENWLSLSNGKLVSLTERHFQIGSLSKAIPLIACPDDIVCLVDSDDYLLPHALQTVDQAYQDPNVAMTYGNVLIDFRPYQDIQEKYFYDKKTVNTQYHPEVWKNQSFREDGFRCFHLRTFRRWLWDYIDPKGFRRPNGEFIRASGDSAYMFPILELLANPKHVAFIDTPLYVYRLHEGNVHNHDKKSQSDDLDLLRFKMKKYPPLDRDILRQHLERSKRSQCAE